MPRGVRQDLREPQTGGVDNELQLQDRSSKVFTKNDAAWTRLRPTTFTMQLRERLSIRPRKNETVLISSAICRFALQATILPKCKKIKAIIKSPIIFRSQTVCSKSRCHPNASIGRRKRLKTHGGLAGTRTRDLLRVKKMDCLQLFYRLHTFLCDFNNLGHLLTYDSPSLLFASDGVLIRLIPVPSMAFRRFPKSPRTMRKRI